ncbi:hypothetical protein QJQ45_018398, partial [Haematococcus lacustris]
LECSSECGLVTELLHDSSFELGALAALWPSEEPLLTGSSTATLVAVGSGGGSSSGLQSLAAVAGADEMPAARPGTWQWSDIVEATYTGITGGQLGAAAHALCISASTTEDVVLFHTGHTGQGFPVAKGSSFRLRMRIKGHAHIIQVLLTSLDDKTTCSLTHVVRQHDQSDEDWEELSVTLTATHACPQARLLLRQGWCTGPAPPACAQPGELRGQGGTGQGAGGGYQQGKVGWSVAGVPGLGVADTRVSMGLRMPAEGKLRRFHQQLVEAVKHLGPQFARIPVQRSPRFAEGTQEPRPLPGLLFPNLGAGGLSLLDTMELARQLGAAPLLVLSLSSPASPGHNPDLLPLTQDVLASLEFLTANSSSSSTCSRGSSSDSDSTFKAIQAETLGPWARVPCRWGAEREAQGQPQPLPLTHLVVGQDADCSQPWYAQAYQQLAAAVRASFPHLQLLACADLGTLPVMDGWELQAQLDPDTTARLGEALDAYQGKPLSVVLGQPHRLQGTGARPGDSVLAGLMAAARSLVLERHCDRVTMVSSQGLLLPAQNPSQPWGKHHSLIVYSATHQALETPAAQLRHLLRQHQGSLCAKGWQLLSSPADSGQVESSASCNDAACTHLILKLVNQGHMKQAVGAASDGDHPAHSATPCTFVVVPDAPPAPPAAGRRRSNDLGC